MKKFLFAIILFGAMLFGGVASAEDGKCLCTITEPGKFPLPTQPVNLSINNEINCKAKEEEVSSVKYIGCVWVPATKPPAKPAGATAPTAPSAPAGPSVSAPAGGTSAMPEETKLVNPIGGIDEPGKERGLLDMRVFLGNVIKKGLGVIGSVTLVVFIYGGFLWLISAGNQEQVKKGMQTMLWAVIGIFIIFASYGILTLVLNAIGAVK